MPMLDNNKPKTTAREAYDYNLKAKEQGREDWRSAYSTDVLSKKDNNPSYPVNVKKNEPENSNKSPVWAWNGVNDTMLGKNKPNTSVNGDFSWQKKEDTPDVNLSKKNDKKDTTTPKYTPVNTYQEWIERWKKPIELVDLVESKYGIQANFDPKTNTITWANGDKKYTWTFDKGGFARRDEKIVDEWAKKEEYVGKFQSMLEAWATRDELAKFISSDKWLAKATRDELKNIYKQQVANKKLADSVKKFNAMDGTQLYKSLVQWKLTIWSKQFNSLYPETQNRLNQAIKENRKLDIMTWKNLVSDITSVKANEVFNDVYKYLSTDYVKILEDKLDAPEYKEARENLNEQYSEIKKKQRQLKNIRKKVEEANPHADRRYIESLIRKESASLEDTIETMVDEYEVDRWVYQDLKDDLQMEVDALKLDNTAKFNAYQISLNQYNKNMDIMREEERYNLTIENQKLAEERAFKNQTRLIDYQNKIAKDNLKGQWVQRDDGLYYVTDKDWTLLAEKVLDSTGEVTVNDDWSYTYTKIVDNKPYVKTYDMNWNEVLIWGEWVTWGDSFVDLSDKYPNDAGIKNNNTAWITWGATSNALREEWEKAGVNFKQGTPRPESEWGTYVYFDSVQDSIIAHEVALRRKKGTIWQALVGWVWTKNKKYNQQYAQDVFNTADADHTLSKSGITLDTPMSELNDSGMYNLVRAQIKRESPWVYKEMENRWYWGKDDYNLPNKKLPDTDGNTEMLSPVTWVPMYYENAVWGSIPQQLKNTEAEAEKVYSKIKAYYKAWMSQEEAMLTQVWFNIPELNKSPENKKLANEILTTTRQLGETVPDGYMESLALMVNQWNMRWAVVKSENTAQDYRKQVFWESFIPWATVISQRDKTKSILELIEANKGDIGLFAWNFADLEKKFENKEDYQRLKTSLQELLAHTRKHFAWSAVTETELKALEDFVWLDTTMPIGNLTAWIETILEKVAVDYNAQRQDVWLPILNVEDVWNWSRIMSVYKWQESFSLADQFLLAQDLETEENLSSFGVWLSTYLWTNRSTWMGSLNTWTLSPNY